MHSRYVEISLLMNSIIQIAKYKKWARYTIFSLSTGFSIVTFGLLVHKSRNTSEDGNFFDRHNIIARNPFHCYSWLNPVSRSLGTDVLGKISDCQKRCSGVEYIIGLIEDLTDFTRFRDRQIFIQYVRDSLSSDTQYSWTKQLDLDALESAMNQAPSAEVAANVAREVLLRSFIEHAEFINLFAPHLVRVPRDVDGRLIPNKDAGCSPPWDREYSRLPKPLLDESVQQLSKTGILLVNNIVDKSEIESVRDNLRIKTSYGSNTKPFETRETVPEHMFEGDRSEDVSYTQLASGRFSYQLRCSKLEPMITQIHRSVMPIVWRYLYLQRPDSLLNQMTEESASSSGRVFLSSVSLVCADPLAGKDSWHANNGAGGVVVMVPLTPFEEKTGSLVVIPGSHKSWTWPRGILDAIHTMLVSGGPTQVTADIGDVFIMDGRIMRKNLPNEKFNKSKIHLAFHYDFTDKPAPSQWLTTTLAQNALAYSMEKMAQYYPRIPKL